MEKNYFERRLIKIIPFYLADHILKPITIFPQPKERDQGNERIRTSRRTSSVKPKRQSSAAKQ